MGMGGNTMFFGAIEAGGTKFVCGIGTKSGELIERVSFPTELPHETMKNVISFFKGKEIEAIGIGCFGPIDLNKDSKTYGYITSTPKTAWKNFNLVGEIKKNFDIPVYFDTDVNAAAFGEYVWGAGKNLKSSIYLTVGTGIGGGAVVEGKLVHGMLHPEMGHIFVNRHPRDKFVGNCPFHGGNCLEGMASGPALERRWGMKGVDIPDDHPAWEMEGYYIAHALVNYILVLSPEKIMLGGGVMREKHLFPIIRKKVVQLLNGYIQTESILKNIDEYIVPPALGEDAGILGALALCFK
jgi:fructokinase